MNQSKRRSIVLMFGVLIGLGLFPDVASACKRRGDVPVPEVIASADAILVARAAGWESPPVVDAYDYGDPAVTVRFERVQMVKGTGVPEEFVLPGYITVEDDFNDQPVPYATVRPSGRGPACFAASYKAEAFYLFVMKRTATGGWVVHPESMAPVNEQLRPGWQSDPWLVWVRGFLARS